MLTCKRKFWEYINRQKDLYPEPVDEKGFRNPSIENRIIVGGASGNNSEE